MSTKAAEDKEAFHIRQARKQPSDAIFIAEAFDSSSTFLASIGSELQWGSKMKTSDAAFIANLEQYVSQSIEASDTAIYIAEKVDEKDDKLVRCGAALVMSILPDYVKECSQAMSILNELDDFDYLYILVADRRVHELSKGAGSFLIQHVILQARRKGRKAILVDCWDGNNEKLIK